MIILRNNCSHWISICISTREAIILPLLANSSNFVSKKRLAVGQEKFYSSFVYAILDLNIEIRVILLFQCCWKKGHKKRRRNVGKTIIIVVENDNLRYWIFVKLETQCRHLRLRIMRWTYSCFYTWVAMKIEQKKRGDSWTSSLAKPLLLQLTSCVCAVLNKLCKKNKTILIKLQGRHKNKNLLFPDFSHSVFLFFQNSNDLSDFSDLI